MTTLSSLLHKKPAAPQAVVRISLDIHKISESFPPKFMNKNKKLIYDEFVSKSTIPASATITYARYRSVLPPSNFVFTASKTATEYVDFNFSYESPSSSSSIEWHLNFADEQLFGFYSGNLYAQDEAQVMEHPVLGSLRQFLLSQSLKQGPTYTPITVQDGKASPVLVMGAPRQVAVRTNIDEAEQRPNGLYGNEFAKGSAEAIRKAVQVLDPPTISNILAIAAPRCSHGVYQGRDIRLILETAYSGFLFAKIESKLSRGEAEAEDCKVTIHTGLWGCGAFGGNPVMMIILQVLAARMAGIDKVVIHAKGRVKQCEEAFKILNDGLLPSSLEGQQVSLNDLLTKIEALKLKWGHSDGN